ncbi:MAG: hypothetical protein R3B57_01410 [Phycisphaerales bacterium]
MRIVCHTRVGMTAGLIACMSLSACSDQTNKRGGTGGSSEGAIRVLLMDLYSGDNASETYFASGTVSLAISPENEPGIGSWSIASDSEPHRIPLGSGKLRWREEEERLIVELHPDMVDNNVELLIEGEHGTWQYLTDAGVTESGMLRVTSDTVED